VITASFTLPYPVSANRYWRNCGGRMVVSSEGQKFKIIAARIARSSGVICAKGTVAVAYTLHPKTNKDGSASGNRIDLGNCEKIASDALNGVAWIDDKQLVKIVLELGKPMLEGGLSVTVRALT
jgi:crossover junction endodeoxyribonuclease RusA